MPAPNGNSQQAAMFLNCSICETKSSTPLVVYQGAQRPTICMWYSKFRIYMMLQICAGNSHMKSWKCSCS